MSDWHSGMDLEHTHERLRSMQERLADHYGRLATERRLLGWPVFALEHGLGPEDRKSLAADVRARASFGPEADIVLPWIVYAAEIGYEYAGHEYWQTFEATTPGWQATYEWQKRIRSAFEAFAKKYHGAEIDGVWANQFNIIAWPITHGLLPQDLQRQLAALLYDARWSFSAATFESGEALGLHLQRQCEHCSSRFRHFAENTTLLGQIALALLLQQDAKGATDVTAPTLLHAATLSRIIEDLSRERDANHWLTEARATASGIRLRGLSRITVRSARGSGGITAIAPPDLGEFAGVPKPRFLLWATSPLDWQVRLQLPNFAQVAREHPRASAVLTSVQGRVAGPNGPLLPKGRLLAEQWPAVTLRQWPKPSTPLLTFDGAPPELEVILQASFRMTAADRWLFIIGADGQAREMVNAIVRPGESYLLLQREEIRNPASSVGLRAISVACADIHGIRIDVPRALTDDVVAVLRILKLEATSSLEAWPAGLPAADWPGDGRGVWVAGAPVVLGLRSDRKIERMNVLLDGVQLASAEPSSEHPVGKPLFVRLPNLLPGHYDLVVAAEASTPKADDDESAEEAAGTLKLQGALGIEIREPRPSATGNVGALHYAINPTAPSLEDLWEDRIDIHVAAPGAPSIRCRLSLRDKVGRELYAQAFPLPSPADSQDWRRVFRQPRKAAERFYDDAHLCVLEFDAAALGRARLVAERDFRSLRWAVRENGHRAVLIDSQGAPETSVTVRRCVAPVQISSVEPLLCHSGLQIGDGGVLITARNNVSVTSIVVVPQQSVRTFADLSVRPQVGRCAHSLRAIREMLEIILEWERARLAGSALAQVRRDACVDALVGSMFGALGGPPWAEIEGRVGAGHGLPTVLAAARPLIAPAKSDDGTKHVLAQKLDEIVDHPRASLEAQFASVVHWLVGDAQTERCSHFALRLARSPLAAVQWAQSSARTKELDSVDVLLQHLQSTQFVARAARYVTLRSQVSNEGLSA